MNIISFLRQKGGLLIGTLGGAVLIFILSQGIYGIVPILARKNKNTSVGTIAGTKILLEDYDKQFQNFKNEFTRRENRSPNDEEIELIHELVWKNFINHYIQKNLLKQEYNKIGISVSNDELVDMVQGEHINDHIKKIFINPYTKKFEIERLKLFLKSLPNQDIRKKYEWNMLEQSLIDSRMKDKYQNILTGSVYKTHLEREFYQNYKKTNLILNCLLIPYSSTDATNIKISDKMIKEYMSKNKSKYHKNLSKNILYINLKIIPSKEDKEYFENEIHDIIQNFKTKNVNTLNYAKLNSDNAEELKQELQYKELKQLTSKKIKYKIGTVFLERPSKDLVQIFKINNIKRKKGKIFYEIIKIEKNLLPSDNTKDQILNNLNIIISKIKKEDDFKNIQNTEIKVLEQKNIQNTDLMINQIPGSIKLIKWLFKKNNRDKISPIFSLDHSFMVVYVVKTNPKGLQNIEDVRDEISEILKNDMKGDIIIKNLDTNLSNLKDVNKSYTNSKYYKNKKLNFDTKYLQDIGDISKSVSYCFTLKNEGDMTVPIKEKNGVIIYELRKIIRSEDNKENNKKLNEIDIISEYYHIYEALKDLAKVKENIKDIY